MARYRRKRFKRRGRRRFKKRGGRRKYHRARLHQRSTDLGLAGMWYHPSKHFNVGAAILPDKTYVTFKNCKYIAFTSDAAAGLSEDNTFAINSPVNMYGGTIEPTTFDEWMNFYNKGRVVKSKIKITWLGKNTANDIVVGLIPEAGDGASALPADIADTVGWTTWCEYPKSQHRVIPEIDVGTGNKSTKYMSYKCTPSKFFKESLSGNDKYDFTRTVGPKNLVGMHFIIGNLDTGNNLPNSTELAVAKVEQTMYCMLYDRKNLTLGS